MRDAEPLSQVVVWLGSVMVATIAGLILVGATHNEFLDCSNPNAHESADTALGWTIAVLASALPVGIAVFVAGGPWRRLPALAVPVALLSLAGWWWMIGRGCDW